MGAEHGLEVGTMLDSAGHVGSGVQTAATGRYQSKFYNLKPCNYYTYTDDDDDDYYYYRASVGK